MKNNETNITLAIYSNYNGSKIFNLPNIKHNTIKMPLKVFYTSINGFPLHLLSRSSIHITFRLTYKKHLKYPQRVLWYMLKVIVRDSIKLLLKFKP